MIFISLIFYILKLVLFHCPNINKNYINDERIIIFKPKKKKYKALDNTYKIQKEKLIFVFAFVKCNNDHGHFIKTTYYVPYIYQFDYETLKRYLT